MANTDLEKLINIELLSYYDTKLKTFLTSTYTKLSDFQALTGFEVSVVEQLPVSGVKGTIYLVPKGANQDKNIYDEYLWLTDKFEKIGDTEIDLSSYGTAIDISSSNSTANGVTTTAYTEKLKNNDSDLSTKTFTAVTAISNASSSSAGLMSSADKVNLDDVVSKVAAADTKYITGVSGSVTNGSGYSLKQTIGSSTTEVGTISLASASADGLMALADKSKLDSISVATNAAIDKLFE